MPRLLPTLLTLLALPIHAAPTADELHEAARAGDAERVAALLADGADVDAPTRYGATALTFAAQKGHADVVKVLLDAEATVHVRDSFYGQTPLTWSLGTPEISALLLAHGAEEAGMVLAAGVQRGETVLIDAALASGRVRDFERDVAVDLARQQGEEELAARLEAADVAADPPPIAVPGQELTGYVGTYKAGEEGGTVTLTVAEGKLRLSGAGHEGLVLEAIEPRHFRAAGDRSIGVRFFGRAGMTEGLALLEGASTQGYRYDYEADGPAAGDAPRRAEILGASQAVERNKNWPTFRGPDASGIGDGHDLVSEWDVETGENVRWKTEIPGLGLSSPVVWGERIFVTTAVSGAGDHSIRTGTYGDVAVVDDDSEHVWRAIAIDASSGEVLWTRDAGRAEPLTDRHLKSSQANSTPATDGRRVVAVFPTVGMFCWSVDGELLWKKELGALNASWFYDSSVEWGYASSPILYDDLAILQVDVADGAYLAAYDLETGREVWKTERDEVPTWATPTVYRGEERHELIANGTTIRGYDPRSGDELWRLEPTSELIIATPVFADDLIYVSAGYPPVRTIYAIRAGAEGDISLPAGATSSDAIAWSYDRGGAYMPTPIVYRGIFYIGHHDARLATYDALTGEPVYRARFSQRGTFTGSPVAADGKLYFPTEDGSVYVIKAGPVYEELAINEMGEVLMTTPAIANDTLYLRTRTHLVAVGEPKE